MTRDEELETAIHDTRQQLARLEQERAKRKAATDTLAVEPTLGALLSTYSQEADHVTQHMDDWVAPSPVADRGYPLSILFLGGCSGEWAARTRWRGTLPGFGGFVLLADGQLILVDPGRGTFDALLSLTPKLHPVFLDRIIVTHAHWDCVRDLRAIVMAASRTGMECRETSNDRLQLLAHASVLYGEPIESYEAVFATARQYGDLDTLTEAEAAGLQSRVRQCRTMIPGALEFYDLFFRLKGRFKELRSGSHEKLKDTVDLYARRSYHGLSCGSAHIPSLDLVVKQHGVPVARCVYLSDTEYRDDLASQYASALPDQLKPIDVLICNVKTLHVLPYEEGHQYQGYTKKHLGWQGLLQLTEDFQKLHLLTHNSLVVLRAWGIETVTIFDSHDKALVAMPEKLRIYEEMYRQHTGLRAVIPDITWVDVPAPDSDASIPFQHLREPYVPHGMVRRFGEIYYRSEVMEKVVREAKAVLDNPVINVLIRGEPGVGKDALGRALHEEARLGGKRRGDIIHRSGPSLGGGLAVPELFGHTKGAFTGAVGDKIGACRLADYGTLHISEIGDASPTVQANLLDPLRERKYRRVGDSKEFELTAQVILTTHRPIADRDQPVQPDMIRSDLTDRCRTIEIPPLRQRPEDISAILEGWRRTNVAFGNEPLPDLNPALLKLLQRYPWPGNVPQIQQAMASIGESHDWSLENVERIIQEIHKKDAGRKATVGLSSGPPQSPEDQNDASEEEGRVLHALADGQWYKAAEVANSLGLSLTTTRKYLRDLLRQNKVQHRGKARHTQYCRAGSIRTS